MAGAKNLDVRIVGDASGAVRDLIRVELRMIRGTVAELSARVAELERLIREGDRRAK